MHSFQLLIVSLALFAKQHGNLFVEAESFALGTHQHLPRLAPLSHQNSPLSRRHHHKKRAASSRKSSARPTATSCSAQINRANAVSSSLSSSAAAHIKSAASSTLSSVMTSASANTLVSKSSQYNWTDYTKTAYGTNLGSWLMLEKWMSEKLFAANAPNAVDDYTFAQTLGSKTAAVLKPYWESWVTTADIANIAAAGANMVRIPVGYWAFHENVGGDPFPALQGQQAQITRVLKQIAKHGMFAIIDLHSMPGRASQDQCNGRLNGPVQFYDANMQQYNDAVIRNVHKFVTSSKYRSSIAAIGAVNEPDVCMTSWNQQRITAISAFYQRSYDFLSKQKDRVPLIIHHGYCGLQQWKSFVSNKDPNYLIMEDHPYSGTFASTSSQQDALGGVCYKAQEYSAYPVPVVVTEATMMFRVNGASGTFQQQMFGQQVAAFAASGGTIFWSHHGDNNNNDGWNFLNLVSQGVIPTPGNGTSLMKWARGQQNSCSGLSTPPWA